MKKLLKRLSSATGRTARRLLTPFVIVSIILKPLDVLTSDSLSIIIAKAATLSFVDATGRVAVVEDDYPKADPLLLAIEDLIDKSPKFRIVLTPKNDPISHHDHFHIEASADFRPLTAR